MPLKAYWAYDFTCDRSIESMLALFNEAGPWQWELRDSAWYGEYLSALVTSGVRVRVHEYPFEGMAGVFIGLRGKGFSALLEIKPESSATQANLDKIFRGLLTRLNAKDITDIEPYD